MPANKAMIRRWVNAIQKTNKSEWVWVERAVEAVPLNEVEDNVLTARERMTLVRAEAVQAAQDQGIPTDSVPTAERLLELRKAAVVPEEAREGLSAPAAILLWPLRDDKPALAGLLDQQRDAGELSANAIRVAVNEAVEQINGSQKPTRSKPASDPHAAEVKRIADTLDGAHRMLKGAVTNLGSLTVGLKDTEADEFSEQLDQLGEDIDALKEILDKG